MSEPKIIVRGAGPDYFLASVAAMAGCIGTGTTRDAAVASARRAFRAYRELLEARGVSLEHWKNIDPDMLTVEDMPPSGLLPDEDVQIGRASCRERV